MFRPLLRVTGTVLVIAVAFVAPVLVTSTPASAGGAGQINSEVSGEFSGTRTFSAGCLFLQQSAEANYTTRAGTGSFSLDGCLTLDSIVPFVSSFSGSFTLTAPDGASLQGTAGGSEVGTSNPSIATLSYGLMPTSGTNEFANVTGFIHLTGTAQTQGGANDTFSGSLGGALARCDTLAGCNLSGLNFSNANFAGADLQGANLSEADLTGANLFEANLTGANLSKANTFQTFLNLANLSDANLSGVNLTAANGLFGTNLTGANLTGATLQGHSLVDVNLTGANLKGADIDNVTWGNTTCPDGTNSNNDGGTCVGHL
jgi:uncharacterized protein YjbI with pentapeptide repeats